MSRDSCAAIIILAGLALLLSACSDVGSDQRAENDEQPQSAARTSAGNDRVMGSIRWEDQERVISQVTCELSHGAWTVLGRGDDFRLRVELHGQEDRTVANLDPSKPLMVNLRLDREEEPNLSFTMNSNHNLMGEVEGGAEGYSGQALLVAANNASGRLYPYPEGIDVEFELNCP